MNEYIEIPVVLELKDIADVQKLGGCFNKDIYQQGSDVWTAGSLMLLGFIENKRIGKYANGFYRFRFIRQPSNGGRNSIQFCKLPGNHGMELSVVAE